MNVESELLDNSKFVWQNQVNHDSSSEFVTVRYTYTLCEPLFMRLNVILKGKRKQHC
jgi:hypothetical protein